MRDESVSDEMWWFSPYAEFEDFVDLGEERIKNLVKEIEGRVSPYVINRLLHANEMPHGPRNTMEGPCSTCGTIPEEELKSDTERGKLMLLEITDHLDNTDGIHMGGLQPQFDRVDVKSIRYWVKKLRTLLDNMGEKTCTLVWREDGTALADCSNCGEGQLYDDYNYCPSCGAKNTDPEGKSLDPPGIQRCPKCNAPYDPKPGVFMIKCIDCGADMIENASEVENSPEIFHGGVTFEKPPLEIMEGSPCPECGKGWMHLHHDDDGNAIEFRCPKCHATIPSPPNLDGEVDIPPEAAQIGMMHPIDEDYEPLPPDGEDFDWSTTSPMQKVPTENPEFLNCPGCGVKYQSRRKLPDVCLRCGYQPPSEELEVTSDEEAGSE